MDTVLLILLILIASPFALIALSHAMNAPKREEERLRAIARRETERELETERASFVARISSEWEFSAEAEINGTSGIVSMDSAGKKLNLVTFMRGAEAFEIISDDTLPTSSVKSLNIDQPLKSRTVTHIDKVPIAVQPKRSAIGRALVGGAVAGPLGAIVGGISAVGGGSKVEVHDSRRAETVYSRGNAKLLLGIDDLSRPVLAIEFADHLITNEWSARIWTAMQRRG